MTDNVPAGLINDLKKNLGSAPTAYRAIRKKQGETFLSKKLSAILLAKELNIPTQNYIKKFVEPEELKILQQYSNASHSSSIQLPFLSSQVKKAKSPSKSVSSTGQVDSDPFITAADTASARLNAELYPIVYWFENSVRRFIAAAMEKDHKKEWWDKVIRVEKKTLAGLVDGRKKTEKDFPWHSKRNAHEIFYTDIDDLKKIINSYGDRGFFKKAMGKFTPRIMTWIEDIEHTRNTLAHFNPVSKTDRNRLTQYANDWHKFAEEAIKRLS